MGAGFPILAGICAALSGSLATCTWLNRRESRSRQRRLRRIWQGRGSHTAEENQGIAHAILLELSRRDATSSAAPTLSLARSGARTLKIESKLLLAGMGGVRVESVLRCRWQLLATGALIGALTGAALTPLAGIVFGVGGALCGWVLIPWALDKEARVRTRMVEQHISEAVEVMCLGLRAGLTFDRSLELYCASFPTQLGREFASAQQTWRTGLLSREEALRNLSDQYDSPVFRRVVGSIVRSLRFGSPLADNLEDLAQEARRAHRAKVEEAVMKAPVKMMMPVGLLILPSMLLLVMGPIMLELFTGF